MVTISQLEQFVLRKAGAKQLGSEERRLIGLTDGKLGFNFRQICPKKV